MGRIGECCFGGQGRFALTRRGLYFSGLAAQKRYPNAHWKSPGILALWLWEQLYPCHLNEKCFLQVGDCSWTTLHGRFSRCCRRSHPRKRDSCSTNTDPAGRNVASISYMAHSCIFARSTVRSFLAGSHKSRTERSSRSSSIRAGFRVCNRRQISGHSRATNDLLRQLVDPTGPIYNK
jgi:hypothetical protein